MNEQQIKEIIKEELGALLKSDRYMFEKIIQIADGRNIQLGLTTGTKIGTSVSQKLSFWNKTPIIQPASADQAGVGYTSVGGSDTINATAVDTNFVAIITLLNQIRSDLVSAGIIKGSA